jgi:peptidyl-prolyl cis-trans isomerase D
MIAAVFDMEVGETRVVRGQDSVAAVRLDAVRAPDQAAPEVAQMRERLLQQASDAMAQDFYSAFADAARARAGVSLNQAAINAVHSNFQ